MLKKLILIDGEDQIQCDTEQDVVRNLIDEDYYELTPQQRREKMKMMASANLLNTREDVSVVPPEEVKDLDSVENKFVLLNEQTYVLSLLMNTHVILLEHKDSNVFTAGLDKSQISKNYVIVNKFAQELLQKRIDTYKKKQLSSENRDDR